MHYCELKDLIIQQQHSDGDGTSIMVCVIYDDRNDAHLEYTTHQHYLSIHKNKMVVNLTAMWIAVDISISENDTPIVLVSIFLIITELQSVYIYPNIFHFKMKRRSLLMFLGPACGA